MRKPVAIFIGLILCSSVLISQVLPGGVKSNEPQEPGKFYLQIDGRAANMMDDWGIDMGLGFGALISKNYSLGIGIYSLISHNVKIPSSGDDGIFLRMAYGGINFDYNIFLFDKVNLTLGTLIGLANITYSASSTYDVAIDQSGSWMMLAEPGFGAYYRVYEQMWVGFNIKYRMSLFVDYLGMNNNDLSGVVISLSFKTLGL